MKISEIKADARQKLTNKWGRAAFIVLGYVIFQLALGFAGAMPLLSVVIAIGSLVITIPINYGLEKSFLDFYHGEEISLFDFVGSGFKNFSKSWSVAWRKFLALIVPTIICAIAGTIAFASLMVLFLGFLGTESMNYNYDFSGTVVFGKIFLVSISVYTFSAFLTGILSLRYVFARLLSMDNPELSGKECIAESRNLMKGNMIKYILLNLSFMGWAILTVFTFGIGMFWLAPYMQLSMIAFYRSLKPKDNSVLYQVDEIVNG